MVFFIIMLLSYLLEVTLKYYLPLFSDVYQYLEPMFFVSFIIIYTILFYNKRESLYFVLGSSFIYDLFFGNILFLYTLIFSIIYFCIYFICSRIHRYLWMDIMIFTGYLILFIILKYLILLLIGYYDYSFIFLINKISSSLILNLLYSIIIYYLFGIKRKKD